MGICIAWLAVPSAVPRGHTTDVHLDAPMPAAATTTVFTRTNAVLAATVTDPGAGSDARVPTAQQQSYLAAPTTSEAPAPDATPAPLVVVPSLTTPVETAVSVAAEPAAVFATTASTSAPTTTTATTTVTPSTVQATTTIVVKTLAITTPTVTLPPTTVDTTAPTKPTQDAPASQEISQ